MDFIKMSEKELKAVVGVKDAFKELSKVMDKDGDLVQLLVVENQIYVQNAIYVIETNELIAAYEGFVSGKTKVFAYDAANYTGAQLIEILYHHYESIFGYYEENGEKIFFLSSQQDGYDDEQEKDYTWFYVEETPVRLDECLKIGL